MKNIFFLLAFLISGFIYSQNIDSLKLKQFLKEIDSIQYTEADFIKFKKHNTENVKAYEFISDKVASGDKNMSNLLNILSLNYQEAREVYGEREIKVLIYSYYKSQHILEKFKKLEADFKATNDSLKLKQELLEKELDSLKKN
jgi:hypothetical protein